MPDTSLAGKKIAVIVESQYIPGEIRVLPGAFCSYGATVDLVSRLWGQPSQTILQRPSSRMWLIR